MKLSAVTFLARFDLKGDSVLSDSVRSLSPQRRQIKRSGFTVQSEWRPCVVCESLCVCVLEDPAMRVVG